MSKYDNYLFRCSELGNIVTKSGKLTQGAQTYISQCFVEAETGKRKRAFGKALEKGVATEQDIIQLINNVIYPDRFVARETESKANEFIKGTRDLSVDGITYDCKSAFDEFTFQKSECHWVYEWQLRGYMWLYGDKQARLFYGLVNMPYPMIYDEVRKTFYSYPGKWLSMDDPDFLNIAEEIEKSRNYDDIPEIERCRVWHIEQEETDIERIKDAVSDARNYMNQLLKEKSDMVEFINSLKQAK